METRLNYSGFIIAGIGFFLTRFTVTLALSDDPMQFYLSGVVPLALGLSLAAFGVALVVANVDPQVVRTTATWCVVGTGTMLALALLTILGSSGGESLGATTIRSQSDLSTFLIGGSIGGTLTGLYAARNHQQRTTLQRQADRLVVLNHMLRHKILNALTPIRGFAAADYDENSRAQAIIESRAADIEQTIEEVRYFTNRTGETTTDGAPTDLTAAIETAVNSIHDDYSDVAISVDGVSTDVAVTADDRLSIAFIHLLDNAIVHGRDTEPEIEVTETQKSVRVSIRDEGPGLPEDHQRLLETGSVGEREKLRTGFGLDLVRLFAERYATEIETQVTDDGTTVMLGLPKAEGKTEGVPTVVSDFSDANRALPQILVVLGASVLAGGVYGLISESLGGSIAGIGVFYGTASPIVGWLTHEFHSVVFGFIFLALFSGLPVRYRTRTVAYVLVGLLWGVILWIGAAGIIAPLWLQLIGIPAPIPNLSIVLLVSHVAWGSSLGLLTAGGIRIVTPVMRGLQ